VLRKADVTIAKNSLGAEELEALNRIVTAYLEFAELQALARKPMYMAGWIARLDHFLHLSERQILTHAGRVTRDTAAAKAEREYDRFAAARSALPSPAETHVEDAVAAVKRLDGQRPRRPKGAEDGRGARDASDPERAMTKADTHTWEFKARFRRHAFGWKSQPAIQRVKQAVAEIKKVARKDAVLAAEGAVTLLERMSPALERIDSSSGAIGTAVSNAIAELVPVIAKAPADPKIRAAWLDRLFEAHGADQIPYIESLADYWSELCASKEVASQWADRLVGITRMALSPDKNLRGYFHGTSACLGSLFRAERYEEILDLVPPDVIWPYKRWVVKALAAQGKKAEAIGYAEGCRGPWASDWDIDGVCEQILLSSGMVDEAYARYGLTANRGGTYLATFRAVARKYPHRAASDILTDLAKTTPGDEGKWFAAAKDAGLFDQALALARLTPCDPKTLARAARDHVDDQPVFAVNAGLLSLHWLFLGYGYEITSADVWTAYSSTMKAAEQAGYVVEATDAIRQMAAAVQGGADFVSRVLGRELGLP